MLNVNVRYTTLKKVLNNWKDDQHIMA